MEYFFCYNIYSCFLTVAQRLYLAFGLINANQYADSFKTIHQPISIFWGQYQYIQLAIHGPIAGNRYF